MEIVIGLIGLIVGVTGVGVGVWQVRHAKQQTQHAEEQTRLAREQLRLAELQHALPRPGTADFGLNEAHLDIDEAILGMYEGRSHRSKPTSSGFRPVESGKHIEQFTIARRAGKLTIVGKSLFLDTADQASHWSGALWKLDDSGTLFFGLELTSQGKREFGTLILTFRGRVAEGFYYSGDLRSKFINSVKAERVDHFSEVVSEPSQPADAASSVTGAESLG